MQENPQILTASKEVASFFFQDRMPMVVGVRVICLV